MTVKHVSKTLVSTIIVGELEIIFRVNLAAILNFNQSRFSVKLIDALVNYCLTNKRKFSLFRNVTCW